MKLPYTSEWIHHLLTAVAADGALVVVAIDCRIGPIRKQIADDGFQDGDFRLVLHVRQISTRVLIILLPPV